MAQYKVNYLMPTWYTVTFEGPDNLTDDEVWEHMKNSGEYMKGEECDWSRDTEWWKDEIQNAPTESIVNITENTTLFEMV